MSRTQMLLEQGHPETMSEEPYAPPKVGATFQPGGIDDFLMPMAPPPDVISPSPQKAMPELPAQMQNDLARLELDATSPRSSAVSQTSYNKAQSQSQIISAPVEAPKSKLPRKDVPPYNYTREGSYLQERTSGVFSSKADPNSSTSPAMVPSIPASATSEPNFSEFPKLHNRPAHVPESDDERRDGIEKARIPVLSSDDIEMQLNWAQDALNFVDTFFEQEERLAPLNGPRSQTPAVEHQIREDAKNIVEFIASQQHPRADFMKSMWLEFGKFGYREDKREAYRGYSRSAKNGYARAEYRMGMQFEATKEPFEALQHYNAGLETRDSACCYRMGMMALLGQLGQPQDFERAIHLIRQAADTADQNAPQGAYVFGMLQAKELPQIQVPENILPTNIASARHYIEKAAFLGFSKAQLKMGSAYELCSLGCEFDPALSLHYNRLAATQGEPEAEMAISKWFLCGYEGVFHKSEEKAYVYGQRAALSGLPMAEFAMGYFNEIGMYVPVNIEKALKWYKKATKGGNKDASSRIEGISKSNTLSKTDHEKIAVSRIKSQYGSKRGQRPDRFTRVVEAMPTVADEGLPPKPVTIAEQRPPPRPATAVDGILPPQLRPVSVTPYPDDRPVSTTPYPDDRPVLVAPYPLDDGPPRINLRPLPGGGFQVSDQRPASSHSEGRYASGTPYSSRPRPPPPSNAGLRVPVVEQPQAPMINNNNIGASRIVSGPPIIQGPGRPASQWQGQSSLPTSRVEPFYNGNHQDKNRPPQPTYYGGTNMPIKQPRPPQSPPDHRSYSSPNIAPISRPPDRPAKIPLPTASPNYPASSPRQPSRPFDPNSPPMMSGGLGAGQTATKPRLKDDLVNVPKPGTRPPGKGPKTFEEMGVPVGRQESDCKIM